MGWDYYTYESQPPFFIEEIRLFMIQEGNREKIDNAKLTQVSRTGYRRGK